MLGTWKHSLCVCHLAIKLYCSVGYALQKKSGNQANASCVILCQQTLYPILFYPLLTSAVSFVSSLVNMHYITLCFTLNLYPLFFLLPLFVYIFAGFEHVTHHDSLSKTILQGTCSVGDTIVCRGNAGWTTSKSGHPSACQNCSR